MGRVYTHHTHPGSMQDTYLPTMVPRSTPTMVPVVHPPWYARIHPPWYARIHPPWESREYYTHHGRAESTIPTMVPGYCTPHGSRVLYTPWFPGGICPVCYPGGICPVCYPGGIHSLHIPRWYTQPAHTRVVYMVLMLPGWCTWSSCYPGGRYPHIHPGRHIHPGIHLS